MLVSAAIPAAGSALARPGANRAHCGRLLCVEEQLASGRAVIVAHNEQGSAICCWGLDDLPPSVRVARKASRAGLFILTACADAATTTTDADRNSNEARALARWLARVQRHQSRLLSAASVLTSSRRLFASEIAAEIRSLRKGSAVLEVGGTLGLRLLPSEHFLQYVSVDPTHAGRDDPRAGAFRSLGHLVAGIAEELPVAKESIDCLIGLFVLEHLVEPRAFLTEISRVLKAGGTALLAFPVSAAAGGKPAFTHRWRFTRGGVRDGERDFPLALLSTGGHGLLNPGNPEWWPVAMDGDACLFRLCKRDVDGGNG